jgi:uncharacterized protein YkwD
MNEALLRIALACSLIGGWYSSDCDAQLIDDALLMTRVSLGTPPHDPDGKLSRQDAVNAQDLMARQSASPEEVNGFTVSPTVRSSVVSFYENVYLPVFTVPINWSGNPETCDAGSTSQAYIDASFDLINYYRAMVELPAVVNDTSKNASAQEAALMMSVNNSLSHSPTDDWECFSPEGDTAAGSSNLALGAAGPRAINLYIRDPGVYNTAVGHRRWILSPTRSSFGIGSVGGGTRDANSLWVFAGITSRPATDIVAWPPRGFVPYRLVYPRWSFSLNNAPNANYSSATVSMYEKGVPVALNIVSSTANGYGDNTLVWEPLGLAFSSGQADRKFNIVISNITNAGQSEYSYQVTVIDPAMVPSEIFSDSFE